MMSRHSFPFRCGFRLLTKLMLACLALQAAQSFAATTSRERLLFDEGWFFQKDDPAGVEGQLDYLKIRPWILPTGSELQNFNATAPIRPPGNLGAEVSYSQIGFNDRNWRQLNLPHDWGIETPFKQENPGETGKLTWWGVGWYRKHFSLPAEDLGKRIYLDLDGAMSFATVWLNGQIVGGWPYGYSSFRLDLTAVARPGSDNVLAIRLDNPAHSSRWYPGAGLYRHTWLVKAAPVHVAHWGTFVTSTRITPESATVTVDTTLENHTAGPSGLQITHRIYELDADGKHTAPAVATSAPIKLRVPTGKFAMGSQSAVVPNPKLWSLKKPNLYAVVTSVEQDGRVIDEYETSFGIRSLVVDVDKGLFLNGERVLLNGVCDHHDLGALGSAINTRALQRQIELLQEMGCNAIRTSHNPPAPELLELCDRMGMLVMDESFDAWHLGKTSGDYSTVFDDWHEKDLRALVRRDRNHPCVVLWSIGNEIREQGSPEGWKLAAHLAGIVREEDRTRPVTAAFNHVESGYNGFQNAVDVVGFNYKPTEYPTFRQFNPGIPVMGSETSSCISSRGEYFFPVEDDKSKGRANFQMSSYDLYAPPWALPPDAEFKGLDQFPAALGEFVWTGFDYLGEPTPYSSDTTNILNFTDPAEQARMTKELQAMGKIHVPSRSSYFGILDLAGFKKDRFFIYQARWRPDFPMAHILPHWSWAERAGQVTPVHVYTSGDEAELFLNGKSLGRKKKEALQYRLRWDDVKYEPGELRVVAYKGGQKWAEDSVKTTGQPAKLVLQADRAKLKADGQDLSYVTVAIGDSEGRTVPRSKNHVRFELAGPGEIFAVDNGDATSFEPFHANERNTFNGLCLVVVRTKASAAGTITLKAVSEGLSDSAVTLTSER